MLKAALEAQAEGKLLVTNILSPNPQNWDGTQISPTLTRQNANGKGVVEGESYTLNTVDRHAVCHSIGFCPNNSSTAAGLSKVDEKSPTLSTTKNVATCYPINTQIVTRYNKLGEGTGMGIGNDGAPAYTLQAAHSHAVIYAIDRAAFNQGENAKYDFQIDDSGINSTIVARGSSAVLDCRLAVWIVRRLTPRECERLQGFPDDWTMYDASGNELKDTPKYKALGNSIAIPCALRVFQGIVETMAEQWEGNAKESGVNGNE